MSHVVETAHSWGHLQDLLFSDSWDPALQRVRSPLAFRGLSDCTYCLHTSLIRLGGDFAALERNLLRSFRKYAHRDVVERDSIWHWLSVAQHHGLPTRLLDWTYSPLVAMHFATANACKSGLDGVIWSVDFVRAKAQLPEELRRRLEAEKSNVFSIEMLAESVPSLDEFDQLSPQEPFLLFFEPPSMDDRIVNQYALFSVLSDPRVSLGDWLRRFPEFCKQIVIPAGLKWEVRDKLDQANVTERVLFPGVDGLTRWLRRHYSPRER